MMSETQINISVRVTEINNKQIVISILLSSTNIIDIFNFRNQFSKETSKLHLVRVLYHQCFFQQKLLL